MKKAVADLSRGIWALPPFPLVLVTVGQNIMTAGAFHFYSFEPPSVMVGIMPEQYTYELISQQGEFGVNVPTAEQLELARVCGSVSGRDEADKYARAGVTAMPGREIDTCLIAECPLSLECVVVHRVAFGGSHRWFVGEIKAVHLDEGYERDDALVFWAGEYRRVGDVLWKPES